MIFRDITVCASKEYLNFRAYNFETNCTTNLFLRALGVTKNPQIAKIIIECCELENEIRGQEKNAGDVFLIKQFFDFNNYWKQNEFSKKKIIAELIYSNLMKIYSLLHIEKDKIIDAYNKCKELEFKNEFIFKKHFKVPGRKCYVDLVGYFDLGEFNLNLLLYNQASELLKQLKIFSSKPHEIYFHDVYKKTIWLDETKLSVIKKNGEVLETIDIAEYLK